MSIYYPGMEFEIPEAAAVGMPWPRRTSSEQGELQMPVTKVEDFEQFQSIISQEERVLVKFEADWCSPCRAMSSVVEEVAKLHPDVKVLAVDIEGEGIDEVLSTYGVRSVPTFVHVRSGAKVRSTSGTVSKAELSSLLAD